MSELLMTLLSLGSKLMIYIGFAIAIGGLFITLLTRDQPVYLVLVGRYMRFGIFMAILAVVVNFFVQVGHFAESGLAGMFDLAYANVLWSSATGKSVMIRLLALGTLLLSLTLLMQPKVSKSENAAFVLTAIAFLGALALAGSFALSGHTSELASVVRMLLSIHVLIALIWIGSLLPLWQACQILEINALQRLMHQFGLLAMGIVIALLICGVLVAYQLLGSLTELITTNYGRILLIKVAAVSMMLGFAAFHRWRLVPKLTHTRTVKRLERSILLESLVGLGVLIITVLMTTLTGPESVHGH